MQRKDFAGLFEAMDGFPVVIRTLDPPLHEFVPKREELMVDIAKLPAADIKTKKEMVARYKNFGAEVKNLKTVIPDLLNASNSSTSSTPCSATAAAVSASPIPRSPRCRRAPSSKPSCRSQEGQEGHPRSHDPADRRREGTGEPEGDREARGRRSSRQGRPEEAEVPDRHHDRDPARRARWPTRSPRKPSSSASAPTT